MGLTARYIGTYVSAESAANYIDAAGIASAAKDIITELEEFNNLASDVRKAGGDLTVDTLSVDGKDFSPQVENLATAIEQQCVSMSDQLEQIISAAETAYNNKQDALNADARARDAAEAARRIAAMNSRSN